MMYVSLIAELEEMIENNEINQFDEVDLEIIIKLLDKSEEE